MDESNGTQKTYYSIGEVCTMTGLEPHVLRYWETEFPLLRPKKNRAGNRAYRSRDIELIKYIRHLLYEEQYTIPGARKKCARMKDDHEAAAPAAQENTGAELGLVERRQLIRVLKEIAADLRSMSG